MPRIISHNTCANAPLTPLIQKPSSMKTLTQCFTAQSYITGHALHPAGNFRSQKSPEKDTFVPLPGGKT